MRLSGRLVSGIGDQTRRQQQHLDAYTAALGYVPHLGSLNVELDEPLTVADLGAPPCTITVEGDVSALWPATLERVDGPAHLMVFRVVASLSRVELLAPRRLRDHLDDRVAFNVTT